MSVTKHNSGMRAQHILYFVIIFFLASTISSCSESTSPSTPMEIVPLREGTRWIYSVSQYDSAQTLRWTLLDTLQIGTPTIHNGKTWYPYVDISYRLSTLEDTLFYRNENDGLWAIMYLRLLNSKPYQLYKYPAIISDTFATYTNYSFDSSTVYRQYEQVGGLQDIISVPAGTFSCIRYDTHLQSLDPTNMTVLQDNIFTQSYVAPGIGLIKSINYNYGSTREQVLVSYTY